jgi:hypothetical protein
VLTRTGLRMSPAQRRAYADGEIKLQESAVLDHDSGR